MKRVFRNLLFIGLCLAVLSALSFVSDPSYWYGKYKIHDGYYRYGNALTLEENTVDVLIAGDSESYTSVSVPTLYENGNLTAVCMGVEGSTFEDTVNLVQDVLERQSPKYVLVETNCMHAGRRDMGRDPVWALKAVLNDVFPVLQFHGCVKAVLEEESEDGMDYMGYEPKFTTVPYSGGDYMDESVTDEGDWTFFMDLYLKKLKGACEEKGTELILYSSPAPLNFSMRSHNILKKACERAEVTYIDFNMLQDELGINWSIDTCDGGDHMNARGAEKITSYLLENVLQANEKSHSDAIDAYYQSLVGRYHTETAEFLAQPRM